LPDFFEKNETKSRIFNVAAYLFAERGYNGVSMREISEASKVTKPTIYYYFQNKEAIFMELLEKGLNYNLEGVQNILNKRIPTKEKLVEMLKLRFRQTLRYPQLSKFYLMSTSYDEKLPFLNNLFQRTEERRRFLIDLIRQGMDSGEFGPSPNPELAAEIFGASIYYFITKQIHYRKPILTDELAEDIVELIFKGLNE
jgi:AcrR family transcriptional regulator